MSKSLIGLHVDLSNLYDKERENFETFVSETNLALLVVSTDKPEQVNKIREITSPETMIVFQPNISSFNKEGRYWSELTPAEYIERIGVNKLNKNIIFAVAEDAYGLDKSSLRLMVDWIYAVTILLLERNVKVCIGNFPHGKIELHELMNGSYDKLLKVAGDNIGKVWLGFKEYSGIILPFGIGYRYDDLREIVPYSKWDLLNKDLVSERLWLDYKQDIEHFDKSQQNLMRHMWIYERCRDLDIDYPRVLIVGTGWERIPSMAEGQNHIFDALQKRHNTPFLRGANSLEKIWNYYYPNLSFEEKVLKQMVWLDNVFHEHCDGLAFNTWGGIGYKREGVTTFSENPKLVELLSNYINSKNRIEDKPETEDTTSENKEEQEEVPISIVSYEDTSLKRQLDILNTDWKRVILKTAGLLTNVRQYPSVDAEVVSTITSEYALIQEKRIYFDGENYWYPVRVNAIKDGDVEFGDFSNLGWVRADAIFFKTLSEVHKKIAENPTEALLNIKIEYNVNNETHLQLLTAIRNLLYVISENGGNVNTYNEGLID